MLAELLLRHISAAPSYGPTLGRDVGPHVRVLSELAKDLTKVPDHELRTWLAPLEFAPQES